MKIRELKENESLEVIEVTMKPNNTDIFDSVLSDSDTGEYSRIKMRILTDGEIERQTEEISQDINEFYIGENKYQFDVNTLKTKKLYFKNYSYIITYLVSTEYRLFGTIPRKFDIVNDISIYLKNEKDKKYIPKFSENFFDIDNIELMRETICLLTILDINYWCETEEEKQLILNKLEDNDRIKEEELRERYNPDNIFKNKVNENINSESVALIEYKERSIIKRVFDKIFRFLKRR